MYHVLPVTVVHGHENLFHVACCSLFTKVVVVLFRHHIQQFDTINELHDDIKESRVIVCLEIPYNIGVVKFAKDGQLLLYHVELVAFLLVQ